VSGISHYLPATIKNRSAWRLKIIYFLRHHLTGEAYTADFDALTAHDAAAQAAHAHDELGLPNAATILCGVSRNRFSV
jgi:hypothetical protein